MNFGNALEEVKKGKGMKLPDWKEDVIIRAQFPDEHSKMTAPYLYVESRYGRVPWKETMIELFREDWEVVNEKERRDIGDRMECCNRTDCTDFFIFCDL